MRKFIRFTLVLTVVLALSACNLFAPNPAVSGVSVVRLTVKVQNATDTFNTVGQVINYDYEITNTGTSPLAGPVIVTDPQRQVTCPPLDDNDLDPNETTHCTGMYAITQTDLNTGSVINVATATVGTIVSNQSGVTVPMNASSVLKLTKTANPTTYNAIGQQITYTYVITNTGTAPLPPSQFTITDNRLGAPFNCGPATTTPLATGQTVPPCTANYVITQADMAVASLTNSATASGGGAPASQAASATVTNIGFITATPTPTPSSNLSPGQTIPHQVVKGEWLIQIARCYGANFEEVRNANPQIINPHLILPAMTVSVPHIGSVSKIYGPPCISSYTVQSGDTWESIAQKPEHNADVEVLRTRNPGALSVGRLLIIPRNSAGGTSAPLPQPTTATPTPTPTATVTPTVTATLQQAADINSGQGNSSPAFLAEYKGVLYFQADNGQGAGKELWKYDGTTASIAFDVASGPNGSNPASLTVYKDVLYFSADDGKGAGVELWRYDGTNPPVIAADINPAGSSNPASLTVYKDVLYFSADDGKGASVELWRYDGTNPPVIAADINPAGSSSPAALTVYKDVLYFRADGGGNGNNAGFELWKYDGTTASLVWDIATGANGSFPDYLAVYNGALYFSANDGKGAGIELWKYLGTSPANASDPSFVADIRTGADSSFPKYLTEYSGALYFSADDGKGAGVELWKHVDSIPVGALNPSLAADVWNGMNGSNPAYLTKYNGWLYFSADDGKGTGTELWRYQSAP